LPVPLNFERACTVKWSQVPQRAALSTLSSRQIDELLDERNKLTGS
jgi:hypothetical protein